MRRWRLSLFAFIFVALLALAAVAGIARTRGVGGGASGAHDETDAERVLEGAHR